MIERIECEVGGGGSEFVEVGSDSTGSGIYLCSVAGTECAAVVLSMTAARALVLKLGVLILLAEGPFGLCQECGVMPAIEPRREIYKGGRCSTCTAERSPENR